MCKSLSNNIVTLRPAWLLEIFELLWRLRWEDFQLLPCVLEIDPTAFLEVHR